MLHSHSVRTMSYIGWKAKKVDLYAQIILARGKVFSLKLPQHQLHQSDFSYSSLRHRQKQQELFVSIVCSVTCGFLACFLAQGEQSDQGPKSVSKQLIGQTC